MTIDPKAERGHDPLDHVQDRLLSLKQTAPDLLDPPDNLPLTVDPAFYFLLLWR
jgi:hypothetical protein